MNDPDDRIVFEALREAGASEGAAYNAVREVRNMAGHNVVVEIISKINELGARTDSKINELGARTDSRIAEVVARLDAERRIIWALILLMAAALVTDFLKN